MRCDGFVDGWNTASHGVVEWHAATHGVVVLVASVHAHSSYRVAPASAVLKDRAAMQASFEVSSVVVYRVLWRHDSMLAVLAPKKSLLEVIYSRPGCGQRSKANALIRCTAC